MKYYYFLLLSLFFFTACPPLSQPNPDAEISFVAPANFPEVVFKETVTKEKFDLGKRLFYDPILSVDSSISCGSCHQQFSGFAHLDHDLSHGVFNRVGTRNSPSIQNMAWENHFFWDGGTLHLDLQPLAPIMNPLEMDETLPNVVEKLKRSKQYPALFKAAFGENAEVSSANMGTAIAVFMKMLVSNQSKYDQYLASKATLDADELAGLAVFNTKCESCHSGALFTDRKFHNNGLSPLADSGRARITQLPQDLYKFKTPTLRNIEKTAPYMHNGKLNTLEAVLEHYNSGVVYSPTLAIQLQQGSQYGIPLSSVEKQQLIAFLKTLTDHKFLTDKRFAE